METTPGGDPHSGNGVQARRIKNRRRKKRGEAPSNGKTDWEAIAVKAQTEVKELQEKVQELEEGLENLQEKYSTLRGRYETVSKAAMDERSATKLKILQSLWGTIVNFQAKCRDDRIRIDALVDAYMPVLKKGVEEASKPL